MRADRLTFELLLAALCLCLASCGSRGSDPAAISQGGASPGGTAPVREVGTGGASTAGGASASGGVSPAGSSCAAGGCGCEAPRSQCGAVCVDTRIDMAHCGACDVQCAAGAQCVSGRCVCVGGLSECSQACVDLLSDNAHCGACGTRCPESRECQEGECGCRDGLSFCGESCVDWTTDEQHCGACDRQCPAVEACREGVCEGGIAGDDLCEGLADGIRLTQFSLFQTVELPLMKEGRTNDPGIDVVAGKRSLAVAYVEPGPNFQTRQLSARLLLEGDGKVQRVYSASKLTPVGASVPGKQTTWFEFDLPGEQLVAGANYAVEIVNCGPASAEGRLTPRYPLAGYAPLRAKDYGSLRLTFVPIEFNKFRPDTSERFIEEYAEAFRAFYPISSVEVTIRNVPSQDELPITHPHDWEGNLDLLRTLRAADAAPDDVYYYGLLRPTEYFTEFCQGNCSAGIGYVALEDGNFEPPYRAAMGLGYFEDSSVRVALHEIGHAHGRRHAPCSPLGHISGVDPDYPYPDASTGVWGWDFRGDPMIRSPEWATDFMGYCGNQWVSDYTYAGLAAAVRDANRIEESLHFEVAQPGRVGDYQVLLVQPDRVRWRKPRPPGSVASGKAERAWVLDASGAALEAIQVYRVNLADSEAYSLEVPTPKPGWYAMELAGLSTPIVFP